MFDTPIIANIVGGEGDGSSSSFILMEDGSRILQEDGVSSILIETLVLWILSTGLWNDGGLWVDIGIWID